MMQRTYHGAVTPADMARALVAAFNQGNLRCQQIGQDEKIMVQIATRENARSGGRAALSVTIQPVEDGVTVALGQHEWLGAVASLGQTALVTLLNPWNLVGRLDDLAQDLTSLTLADQVWEAVENYARTARATKLLSERLQTLTCPYCESANKVGVPSCDSCGAPLGKVQPLACAKCGHVMPPDSRLCANCGAALTP